MDDIQLEYQADTICRILDEHEVETIEFANDMVGLSFKMIYFLTSIRIRDNSAFSMFVRNCNEGELEYLNLLGEIRIRLEELENYFPRKE